MTRFSATEDAYAIVTSLRSSSATLPVHAALRVAAGASGYR